MTDDPTPNNPESPQAPTDDAPTRSPTTWPDTTLDPASVDPTHFVHDGAPIQAAIHAADPGDTIWIEPTSPFDNARYDEPLVIPESKPGLDLRSTTRNRPVLVSAASGPTPALTVYADDVTIRNLWCSPTTENLEWVEADAALRAHDVAGLHLEDVRGRGATIGIALTDVTSATLAGTGTEPTTLAVGRPIGLQLADVTNITLCNVTIRSASGTGLHVTGRSGDVSVCHARFQWNAGPAITIDELVDMPTVSLHRCDIAANGGPGLLNYAETPVDARQTWWGHPEGPTTTSNPSPTQTVEATPMDARCESAGQLIVGPVKYRPATTSRNTD